MKVTNWIAALAIIATCGAAEAQTAQTSPAPAAPKGRQSGVFIGAGPASYAFDTDAGTFGFAEAQLRGGYIINKYLSISAEVGLPLASYETGDNGYTLYASDVDMKPEYGLFVEPRLPLGDMVGLYVRLGYATTTFENAPKAYPHGNGYHIGTANAQGFAYGAGVDFDFGRHVTLAVDLSGYDTDFNSAAGFAVILKNRF